MRILGPLRMFVFCLILFKENKGSGTGTARYMSINTHLGHSQSRRDDMESLGYMLINLMQGRLPWQGLKSKSKEEHMKKIKATRSHGTDYIDSKILKISAPVIENIILHLVNLSISTNNYAKGWKSQLVLPFYKKKDPLDGKNYWPVSHIIEIGKIVE